MALTVEEYNELLKKYGSIAGVARATERNERSLRRWVNKHIKGETNAPKPSYDTKTSFEYRANGDCISERIIEISKLEDITPESMMEKHGLVPEKWEVVAYRNNFWQSQSKGGGAITLYQSKLTVKPREQLVSFEDIDEYFQNKEFKHTKPLVKPLKYNPDGEVLEVCLPDLHSGLLSWRMESSADYDLKIVKERFDICALDIVARCQGKKLKKIIVITLGDLLHVDNDTQTTTKGTFQQVDGRLSKIFNTTLDMLIDFIDTLGSMAPVEVIYIPGNHDKVTGLMLLKAVEKAYRGDSNFIFDTTPNPQKSRLLGQVLIGWTHGDMPKQNMPNWLPHRARKDYGQSCFAEIHAGHQHSTKTIESRRDFTQEEEVSGIVIRYLPTICNASYWEHQQGYTSASKTMMCFVWNEETGLREMWHSNII